MKTHALFVSRDGAVLKNFQGMEGKRTDPKAVAIEILRDCGRYRTGEYVVVEHEWDYSLPGFDGEYGSDYVLTSEVEAVVKIITVSIGTDDIRKST